MLLITSSRISSIMAAGYCQVIVECALVHICLLDYLSRITENLSLVIIVLFNLFYIHYVVGHYARVGCSFRDKWILSQILLKCWLLIMRYQDE